jgi:molybdopterin-guanine dinucleotide biosynthesis protein A
VKRGILLLSGGSGTRMGTPKHELAHPGGGSWGAHLIQTFVAVFPGGAKVVLGDPLPDFPNLDRLDDPRQGPAHALQTWAQARLAREVPGADSWWIVGCDQVRWTPERLAAWTASCEQADPASSHWVIAEHETRLQPLGGWFPDCLCPALAATECHALMGLLKTVPHLVLSREGDEWRDVDTPEERRRFEAAPRQKH